MEEISDEQIHSLATEWMNKIKSNVGLSFAEKRVTDLADSSTTGENSYSLKQVQNSYDVIYRKGKDNNEFKECQPSSLADRKRTVSTIGNHNEQQRNPAHTSLFKDKATEVFEKQYSKDNSDGLANVDYHVLKSRLEKSDTVQRYDQCYLTKEEPRKEILDSNSYLSSFAYSNNHSRESRVMPTQHLDYSKPSSVVLNSKPDLRDSASSEDHNELFELWDFDADQCETALKYLNKTGVKDKPSSRDLHEKENIPDQRQLIAHDALPSLKSNVSKDDVSTFGDKSRGNWFNDITNIRQDITNIGQDITNENHISEVSSKKIDFESEILSLKSQYYKKCPVCKQRNEATANWCEECGKALVSVEVKRHSSDIKTERNNNDNIHLISKSNPELTNLDEDKKISSFKLNPNSAEFVSAYSKPQSQKGTNIDSHSFNGSSPVDYCPGQKQYNVQMQSPRDQPVRYAGSFPGNQFGNFNSWQVSPKLAWSPTHFSPDMASVGYMKGNVDSMLPRNSNDGAYVSHSGYARSNKNGIEYVKHLPNTSKLQNFSQVNPSTASFSYDSSYSSYHKDVKSRPRSTSLLNIQLNTASPGLADPRFPISFGDASSPNHHQNVQHCVQVAQPQLEAISNGYQGFDFENPQFDPQFSECQAFNETVFSQQFVQSRLHQQIESAYGDPQKYQYYQPSEIPNPLYLQSTSLIQNDVNSGQADPIRMYRKKKLYDSCLDSPRSPKNILRKTKKEKTKFRGGPAKVSRHNDFKDMRHKKLSESNIIVSFSEDEQASSGDQVIVPPLSLEDLDTYDQALTLIRTAREEAVPYLCLPEEIILYILSFLPTSDLCRCARVCKQFHRISTDESLWKEIALRKRNDLSDEILAKIGQKRPISLTISQCHSNMVTEGGLRDLFRNCGESLQDLGFSACSGKALIGELILLHASRCKGLRSIDISWSNVSDIGIQAFSEAVDRLECICMNGCQAVTDESIRCIAVRHSKSIRVIEMFGCFNISYVSLSILQQYCPNLETVNMGQCHKVTNVSVSEFSKQMPKLENIDLRGCKKIRDGAIKDLASNCRSLSTLVIANCSLVTDASLLAIASNLSSIRCLDVCGCTEISDHGVEALAKACNKLEVLDLSSTKATDKGVISLANYCHQTLESLKLSFCHSVTESSLEQLAKKCSRLKLLHLYGCKRVRNVNKVQDLNRKLVIESEAR